MSTGIAGAPPPTERESWWTCFSLISESLGMTSVFETMRNRFDDLHGPSFFTRTMAILGEACNIHRLNAGAKDATDSPLPPSYEDDVTATTDGKEQTTWPAAAGDAEDDDTKQPLPPPPPPPPEKTYSEDDVVDFPEVLRFCRPGPSVELLAVYPYFPFVSSATLSSTTRTAASMSTTRKKESLFTTSIPTAIWCSRGHS